MAYQLITLHLWLTDPRLWAGATTKQREVLEQADKWLQESWRALESIERVGTHICNNDPQLPKGTIIRNREAQLALDAFVAIGERD